MWKRVLAASVLILLVVVGGLAAAIGSAFAGNAPLEDGRTYGDGSVITVVDGYVSCALLDAGDGRYVLVDACQAPDAAAIRAALQARGADLEAVALILLTHGHSDHTGGVPAFPGVSVRAMAAELPRLEGKEAYTGPITGLMGAVDSGIRVAEPLRDGEQIDLGALRITAYAVPGHTPGSAAFLANGALLLGDNAGWKEKGQLVGAPWVFSDDVDQNGASLDALGKRLMTEAATVEWLVPAHTGPGPGLRPLLER